MNNQYFFNAALFGIRKQNYRRSIKEGHYGMMCAYRGNDGLKCGIGHGITDDDLANAMDDDLRDSAIAAQVGRQTPTGDAVRVAIGTASTVFLTALQQAHDGPPVPYDRPQPVHVPANWEDTMLNLATAWSLEYTPPDHERDNHWMP